MSLFTQGNLALQTIEQAMRQIGYKGDLLRKDYPYTDVIASNDLHIIELAGFAQTPPTYRNACIGVVVSNGLSGAKHVKTHLALGAPMLFEIDGDTVNRWKITATRDPEFKEQITLDQIANAFRHHQSAWQPESILRAKAIGEVPGSIQLDFYDESLMPFLEIRNFEKLDFALREILTKAKRAYKQLSGKSPHFQDLFPLAFRFLAAKVFRDRGYKGGWTSDDALTALEAIEQHYNSDDETLPQARLHSPQVLQKVWEIIIGLFRFANLSEDDLALIFENSFITPATRQRLGIHSTPPRVAQYMVQKLPLEDIPESDRYVWEPFAGHGRFLIAAMRRMRTLLNTPLSEADRHNYFRERLLGIELDKFSVEVCRLSLMLADSPNPNHWQITWGDVFDQENMQAALRRTRIVLCNPPFEQLTPQQRERINDPDLLVQKPAEFLRRLLLQPPDMLGIVLPRVFESGLAYRRLHGELAKTYESIELVALPEVFNYSDATTTLLLANGRRSHAGYVAIRCQDITETRQRDVFLRSGAIPPATETVVGPSEYLNPNFSLWIPPLSALWKHLDTSSRYASLSSVLDGWHRGIEWKPASKRGTKVDKYVSATPKEGYVKGFVRAEGSWYQYYVDKSSIRYLSLRPQDQDTNSYKYPWNRPKVVCNASRLARHLWRIGAVADQKGYAFSSRFVCLWPKPHISIFAVAALLNSPLCNAFFKARESGSVNRLLTFGELPIPQEGCLRIGGTLDTLSRNLHEEMEKQNEWVFNVWIHSRIKAHLLQLDAEILRAYDLPPKLEHDLLTSFQYIPRPVPFEFESYYPERFEAYIPLHVLISPEFENAKANQVLARLTPINDLTISAAMAHFHE